MSKYDADLNKNNSSKLSDRSPRLLPHEREIIIEPDISGLNMNSGVSGSNQPPSSLGNTREKGEPVTDTYTLGSGKIENKK